MLSRRAGNRKHSIIDMTAFQKRVISPFDFVHMSEEDKANIKETKIVPSGLGKGFGGIEVTYRVPVYATR